MNPSPDRSKDCLPPKKRESRQGSLDQQAPEDDFKPPAPLRGRRHHHSIEGHRESGGESRFNKNFIPPHPPTLPSLPLSLPWQVSYSPSMHHSYLPVQVGERRGSGSAPWREICGGGMDRGLEHPIPHHSRWLHGDIPQMNLQPLISVPAFKNIYTHESRDVWPYSPSRRDYSSPLFSSHLFTQPTVYPHDTLSESRLRYQSRRPNGVDGPDSRSGSGRRMPSCDDFGNDSTTRSDGSHANGRRRQEDTAGQCTEGVLLSRDSTSAHSSTRERNPLGTPKATIPSSSHRTGKDSQDQFSGSAQIYYALGSLCPSAHQNAQAYPNLTLSDPTSCSMRNSNNENYPQSRHNSPGTEREWYPLPRSYQPAVTVLTDPPPSAVLPHFAKGSLIELAGGHLKRVEELKMEDFLRSADTLPEFHLSTCTILLISPGPTHGFNHLQVLLTDRNTQELLTVLAEYPFFVLNQGWSSCSPQRSAQLYGLQCRQLSSGDVCLALTPTPTSLHSTATSVHSGSQAQRLLNRSGAGLDSSTDTAEKMPPPPAPPPLPPFPFPLVQPSLPDPLSKSPVHPCTRKRRWSAPEFQSENKLSSLLPQGLKQEGRQ